MFSHNSLDGDIGTDNWDFVLEGIPTLIAKQDQANYLPNYHAASDTFDKVDLREVKINTVIAAVTAWGIAIASSRSASATREPRSSSNLKKPASTSK
jgi:hypothetical protein